MGGVTVRRKADEFGVDPGAAGAGVLELLEHERASAFADHEAVTVGVEGTRRELGLVVAGAGSKERVEDRDLGGAELFGAARHHDVLIAVADGLPGVADRLGARRAGARCRDDAAGDAEEEARVDGRGVRHHLHVGRGGDAARVAVDDHLAEVGNGAGAARAGTVGDAGAAALDDRIVDEACLLEGELGRASRKERNAAHRADALARVVFGQPEVEDGRAKPGVESLDIVPFVHAAHRVPVGEKPRLDRFPVLAERRDAAHAGDYDSAHQIMPPLTLMTWRVM